MAVTTIPNDGGPKNRFTLAWAVLMGRPVITKITMEVGEGHASVRFHAPRGAVSHCVFKAGSMMMDNGGFTLTKEGNREIFDAR